ncbi:leucine-rich repeat-containing protein 24-like [Argiope bruennichi]|uniref:leucine-rich repeat-containing protein 24-like n=1 Tax=Argiope bruennichi TaxID=94029 RepID=UPI0024944382|nr:leucine-rich repeat-containing protein 24-like [Argiope bruennichi]XP_055927659.1 leucine-rich repeat-containing protein 24-like [Argiope bruennichi]XP_055927660.1 leucine-rich repeat-containing protein 24-like [Argiope bruennichi]XP_055927661.1 leucine-rich repeat-containing protein 24-like [Argiope bruennichi]
MMNSVIILRAVICVTFALMVSVYSYSECPSVCSCKWKNGKQTAECTGKGLTVIPSDLNAATQVIDISRNSFTEIPSRSFQQKGLVNLQKIFISECGIKNIVSGAFFQLRNLVELDLSGNKLKTIPTAALQDCPNLRRLQLAQNPIGQIGSGVFPSLPHLTNLGLANCRIKHLQPGALDGLSNLESIELNGNQLTTLSTEVLKPLTELHELNLHNNPWYCDCKIQEIRLWMIERKIPLSIPPYCEAPSVVKGMSWKAMSLDDFACPPVMIRVSAETTVIVDHNASILCQVDATPKASIYWEMTGKSLKNISSIPELRAKYNVETEDSSKQSSILTIYNAIESDSDTYVCVAENKAGISSINFTLLVVCPNHLGGAWSGASITLLLVGVIFVILLAAAAICFLVYHPVSLPFGSKINRSNVIQHLSSKKQDAVEMNDLGEEKEEKDLKTTDKQPRHETGSSGYGSDQLTPDLVSKIADMNNGPSLSTSTVSCNHLDSDNPVLIDGYGSTIDHWPLGKSKAIRYDGSPIRNNIYSEIYLNPCYGKDEDPYNYALQSSGIHQLPDCPGDRYIPQNDRVRTLRGGYNCASGDSSRDELFSNSGHDESSKRYPLVVANSSGHYTLPAKVRFSPDEGYAEEGLEGTEV